MHGLNPWAILIAAASSFLLGGAWYSAALFGKTWNREAGETRDKGSGHPARVFGISLFFALVAAAAFAWLLGPKPGMPNALGLGLTVGPGFVAASFGINYQFANRSFKLWLIDGGYHVLQFALYGVVFGLWG